MLQKRQRPIIAYFYKDAEIPKLFSLHIYDRSVSDLLTQFLNIENFTDFGESVSNIGDKPSIYIKYRGKRIQILQDLLQGLLQMNEHRTVRNISQIFTDLVTKHNQIFDSTALIEALFFNKE